MTLDAAGARTADAVPDEGAMRQSMVASQLRPNAVSDGRVVAAMARIPRAAFLPAGARAAAYRDTAVPVGGGRSVNPPLATARLLTAASLRGDDRVLLIGAAGGYAAAILADLVASVVAVESDAALFGHASAALGGSAAVTLVENALADGHGEGAPYDVLVIDGAVEAVPASLVAQVAVGGRVVSGLVERGVTRLAAGVRSAGGFALQPFVDSECVILPGFAAPVPFRF